VLAWLDTGAQSVVSTLSPLVSNDFHLDCFILRQIIFRTVPGSPRITLALQLRTEVGFTPSIHSAKELCLTLSGSPCTGPQGHVPSVKWLTASVGGVTVPKGQEEICYQKKGDGVEVGKSEQTFSRSPFYMYFIYVRSNKINFIYVIC
jgi:hypothetical protein